jgi:hypothetical protein
MVASVVDSGVEVAFDAHAEINTDVKIIRQKIVRFISNPLAYLLLSAASSPPRTAA